MMVSAAHFVPNNASSLYFRILLPLLQRKPLLTGGDFGGDNVEGSEGDR